MSGLQELKINQKRVTFKKLNEMYQGTPYYQLYFNRKKLFKLLIHKKKISGYFYLVDYGETSFSSGCKNKEEMQEILDRMIENRLKTIGK